MLSYSELRDIYDAGCKLNVLDIIGAENAFNKGLLDYQAQDDENRVFIGPFTVVGGTGNNRG